MKINFGIAIFSLLVTILFTGVFRDDEFYDPNIFLKHRPTFKLLFISPTGMSDKTPEDLSPEMQKEELMFEEFVIQPGIQYPSDPWSFVPVLLIQFTLSLFTINIFKSKLPNKIPYWKPIVHYTINLITTTLGLAAILTIDHLISTFGFGLIILAINVFSFYFLSKNSNP